MFQPTMSLWMYQCSLCGQEFQLGENQTAKEAMKELMAAFKDHTRVRHPGDFIGSKEAK
jgi:hypothetical protein